MNKVILSEEQKNIINCDGNIVVIADPGSGKTTTISYKIKKILEENKFKGVIAISYTNKASNELKSRVKSLLEDIKLSYFGTIDKFYISEVIIPFAKNVINKNNNYEVIKKDELLEMSDEEQLDVSLKYLKQGKIILNTIGKIGNYIFDNSMLCQDYLKARYSHIIIDEFQDCNIEQYYIFKKMVDIGIYGIGVGDPNQSIFRYDKRDSKYLISLTSFDNFNTFILNKNHRCHQSIINYSLKFLSPRAEITVESDKRVYGVKVIGDEMVLANKIDKLIENAKKKFEIESNNKIAILVRNNSTANYISKSLKTKNKRYINTVLDESNSLIDILIKDIISYIIGNNIFITQIYEKYDNYNNIKNKNKKIIKKNLQKLKMDFVIKGKDAIEIDLVKEVIECILNKSIEKKDLVNLKIVLDNAEMFQSLFEIEEDTVPIMTIHKAKGLEFDAVFILDLHKFVLPKINFTTNTYIDKEECKNIHYVALTRAKKVVVLCWNTIRTNAKGEKKTGELSEFVRNDLKMLRNENSDF